jgi:hypothetical protein
LDGGGNVAGVAEATSKASREGLESAKRDAGVMEALWMLVQLPGAAKQPDFAAALRERGLGVEGDPSLLGLTAAISERLDAQVRGPRKSDLGEMAALAAVETINSFVGARIPSLFEASPADVRSAVRGLATEKQFGALTRGFFARFTERYLAYYLSRELSAHVGRNERIRSLDDHSAFNSALRAHCHEAARILENFAGEWFSKKTWERELTRETTRRFAAVAFQKLNAELEQRETPARAR